MLSRAIPPSFAYRNVLFLGVLASLDFEYGTDVFIRRGDVFGKPRVFADTVWPKKCTVQGNGSPVRRKFESDLLRGDDIVENGIEYLADLRFFWPVGLRPFPFAIHEQSFLPKASYVPAGPRVASTGCKRDRYVVGPGSRKV